jgi:hypothetical protein
MVNVGRYSPIRINILCIAGDPSILLFICDRFGIDEVVVKLETAIVHNGVNAPQQ